MDFRYLVETKNEFNNFLCGILVPHIFHGIKGMFKYSENVFEQIEQKNKRGARINNPGIIQIFKKTLDGIKELNNHEIEEEYQRIKVKSGCVDFFDNLIRATFKSFVLFLTWDPKSEESKYTDNEIYEDLSIKDFIHKCYIISCDYFKENPELFLNSKSNKKDIFEIIKNCIELALKKSLPFNQIIEEYLQIEFTKKDSKYSKELADVKNLVNDMINNNKYGNRPPVNNIIKEDTEEFINVNVNSKMSRKEEVENFINQEIINENRENMSLIETSDNNDQQSDNNDQQSDNNDQESDNNDQESNNNDQQSAQSAQSAKSDDFVESIEPAQSNENNVNSVLTSDNNSVNNDMSSVVTRSSLKSKELDEILDNNNDLSETSVSIASRASKSSKSQSVQIIDSPPKIRAKSTDRIKELQNLNQKKDINIEMKKKKELSTKISGEIDSYFGSMIK